MSLDALLSDELAYRDRLVASGLAECRLLLPLQTDPHERMFYLGSIQGFETCRAYTTVTAFEKRLFELHVAETRESGKDLKDPELRQLLGLTPSERANENRVWFLKGYRTQVEYVHDHLLAYQTVKELARGDGVAIPNIDAVWERIDD